MSTPSLVNTCSVCGAEESLDALLLRMITDDEARGLIHDVIKLSVPLGGDVIRYLRLHTPAKQKLRMSTIGKLLAELVPDLQRTAIERKGRIWATSPESWRAAFRVVFGAAEKGVLTLPLQGNGYLYGVLVNIADRLEAASENEQMGHRRVSEVGLRRLGELVERGLAHPSGELIPAIDANTLPNDPEAAARAAEIKRKLAADLAARKARQQAEDGSVL